MSVKTISSHFCFLLPLALSVPLLFASANPCRDTLAGVHYSQSMAVLDVPIELKYSSSETITPLVSDSEVLETVLAMGGGFFQRHGPARELLKLLTQKNSPHLESRLMEWTQHYLPQYQILKGPKLNEYVEKIIAEREMIFDRSRAGFIPIEIYLGMIREKVIPIANDHDLLMHLAIFSQRDTTRITQKVADLYHAAKELKDSKLRYAVKSGAELVWQAIQERVPELTQIGQEQYRLGVVGGYPHHFSWRWARPEFLEATQAHTHLFSFPRSHEPGADALVIIYDELQREILSKTPSKEATALHRLLSDELGLSEISYEAIEKESRVVTDLIEKYLLPHVKAGRVEQGMIELGTKIQNSKSKLVQCLFDQKESFRFWEIHLAFMEHLARQ